jgi:hypothetical protein
MEQGENPYEVNCESGSWGLLFLKKIIAAGKICLSAGTSNKPNVSRNNSQINARAGSPGFHNALD